MREVRIAWRMKDSGYSGHGCWMAEDDPAVQGATEILNRDCPTIHHWLEYRDPPKQETTDWNQCAWQPHKSTV